MRIKFESMPKRTKLKPGFRLWLKKLDRLNTEPFMEYGREQPRAQRRRKMFRDPPADTRQRRHDQGGPNGSSAHPLQSLPYYLPS
jgi:hypothetical protein